MMVSARDKHFIEVAYAQAASAKKHGGARVCAIVVLKNKPISFGSNKNKTHPFQAKYAKHPEALDLHAENDAIKNALSFITVDGLRKSTLYISRAKRSGDSGVGPFVYGLAKPCRGCMRAIVTFGLKRVVYTTDAGTIDSFVRA